MLESGRADPELPAVRVDRRAAVTGPRRGHRVAHGRVRVVAHSVAPGGTGWEAGDVAGAQDCLAFRSAECQLALDHVQPFLIGDLEVVRAGSVAGRHLVELLVRRDCADDLRQRGAPEVAPGPGVGRTVESDGQEV